MTQDQKWDTHYEEIISYMNRYKRRPSKHRLEDHLMLNWIKYNKKLKAREKLSADRIARFNQLLALADKYQRINQHAYVRLGKEPETPQQPGLFNSLED